MCIPNQILYGLKNQEELNGRGMWHVRERGKAHVRIWMWTPDTKRPHG